MKREPLWPYIVLMMGLLLVHDVVETFWPRIPVLTGVLAGSCFGIGIWFESKSHQRRGK